MGAHEILFGTKERPESPTRLAKLTGVSVRTVNNWKRDMSGMRIEHLRLLAKARHLTDAEIAKVVRG